MATETPLRHPGEVAQNERFFPDRVAIQTKATGGTPSRIGATNPATGWQNVAASESVACAIEAMRVHREEAGKGTGPESVSTHQILFNAYRPDITTLHRLLDLATGKAYGILAVWANPTTGETLCNCQLVSV